MTCYINNYLKKILKMIEKKFKKDNLKKVEGRDKSLMARLIPYPCTYK